MRSRPAPNHFPRAAADVPAPATGAAPRIESDHAEWTILLADDDAAIRTVLNQAFARRLRGALDQQRRHPVALGGAGRGRLVITDVVMPDENAFDLLPRIKKLRPELPIIVMSAQNTFMTAIKASERGAYEYLPKPFDLKELSPSSARAVAARRAPSRPRRSPGRGATCRWSAARRPMQEIYRALARLMPTDLTVMITGESGTGKELVARALHDYGKRRTGPFVAVNMAAIPRDLIESELFGHEKGAFTGATARCAGRFEQAEGGTLFLDEIGDMPMEAQTRLLRVLQQGEYTTVGGRTPIKTECPDRRGDQQGPARSRSSRACSARICSSASTWCRCACRLCASGSRTSPTWPGTSSPWSRRRGCRESSSTSRRWTG